MQEHKRLRNFVLSKSLCAFSLYCWEIFWGGGSKFTSSLLSHSPTPLSGSLTLLCLHASPSGAGPGSQPSSFPPDTWIPLNLWPERCPELCCWASSCACAISSDRPQGSTAGSRNLFADTSGRSRGSVMLCRQFSLCYCFKLRVSHSCFPGFRVFQIIFPRGIDSIFPNWISFIFCPGFQSLWGPLYYFSVRTAVYNIS